MPKLIDIIRFSVTGASDQLYNYVPLEKNAATKVNINYVVHINNKNLEQMKLNKINRIYIIISYNDEDRYKFVDLPVDELSVDDFLNLSFNFLLQNKMETSDISNLSLSLYYSTKVKKDLNNDILIFNTTIPVKEVN